MTADITHVRFDMDGFTFDFEGHFVQKFNMEADYAERRLGKNGFWKLIFSDPNFFSTIPPFPEAQRMFDIAHAHGFSPDFLTGIPASRKSEIMAQKTLARDKHFPKVPITFSHGNKKLDHGSPTTLLVDDRADICLAWSNAGFHAIHHRGDFHQTGELLARMLKS